MLAFYAMAARGRRGFQIVVQQASRSGQNGVIAFI
jgi:hypothetical protein